MSDSEDDIFSASTVPYDASDSSSIYEKETQALEEVSIEITSQSNEERLRNRPTSENEFYDGPTQPLLIKKNSKGDPLPSAVCISSPVGKDSLKDGDSDCDTIPASPRYCQDSFTSEDGVEEVYRPTSAIDDQPTQPLPLYAKPAMNTDEDFTDHEAASSPVHLLDSSSEIEHNERTESPNSEIYDEPTQLLLVDGHNQPNLLVEKLRVKTPAEGEIDYSECDTLPLSPVLRIQSCQQVTSSAKCRASQASDMDIDEDDEYAKTQPLPIPGTSEQEASSVSTIVPNPETHSDGEILPSSSVGKRNLSGDIPSTQSVESAEPLKGSEVWSALKKVEDWNSSAANDCPLSPDLFSASSPCPDLPQNSTIHSEKGADSVDGREPAVLHVSRNDPESEMDRETLPLDSPVFDFDESAAEETRATTPVLHRSPPLAAATPFVAETPFVAQTPYVPRSPAGTSFVAETPLVSEDLVEKKRKIIRRSAQAIEPNSSIRTSTPEDMVLESSQEENKPIDAGFDTEDSDFELTFASHYSALPSLAGSSVTSSSAEPFLGFEAEEMKETSTHLQEIRKVIGTDQGDSKGKKPSGIATSLGPPPVPIQAGPSRKTESPILPAPRRSTRKPIPNTRRTYDLVEPNQPDCVTRRRRGRPPVHPGNITTKVESSEESDSSRKAISISLPVTDPVESSNEERVPGKRGRPSRKKIQPIDELPVVQSPIAPKRRGRPPIKKEPMDESLAEGADKPQTSGTQRRTTRSVNNNTDTSSIASCSPVVETLRRRKRALAGQVRVIFTVIDDVEDRQIVQNLGGRVVTTFKDCSVLVTDRIRRTVKFLCCVGLGLPIVGPQWLAKCRSSGKFVDPWMHLLRDKEGEKKFNFKLSASLKTASETPLLSGWIFHATPSVLPPPAEMQEIVESCGGFYVEESEDKSLENKIVISCIEDRKMWPNWTKQGAKLIDKEAILTGVLQQKFEPDQFKLIA